MLYKVHRQATWLIFIYVNEILEEKCFLKNNVTLTEAFILQTTVWIITCFENCQYFPSKRKNVTKKLLSYIPLSKFVWVAKDLLKFILLTIFNYHYFLFMNALPVYMLVQNRALGPMGLEFQMAMSCHVGARNWIWSLWRAPSILNHWVISLV